MMMTDDPLLVAQKALETAVRARVDAARGVLIAICAGLIGLGAWLKIYGWI
jgi:hypothetical protein